MAAYGRRRGRRLVPIFALTLSAVLLYFATSSENPIAMVSLLCVALGCAAATEGPFWVAASETVSAHPAAAAGVMNTGGSVGGFLAPVITPFIAERGGWPTALYTGSAVVVGAVVLWFRGCGPGRRSARVRSLGAPPFDLSSQIDVIKTQRAGTHLKSYDTKRLLCSFE